MLKQYKRGSPGIWWNFVGDLSTLMPKNMPANLPGFEKLHEQVQYYVPVPWYATCYASRGPHCFPCRHNSHEPSRYLACICLRVVIVQCPFGGERAACPAGFWTNGQTDSSSCVSCPRGTFYPTDGDADSTCTPCPPGTFSDVSHHRSAAGTQSTLESSGTNSIGCRFATRPL